MRSPSITKSQPIACVIISLREFMSLTGIKFLSRERVDAFTACVAILATNSLCNLNDSGVARKFSIPLRERARLSARLRDTPSTSAMISV